MTSPWVHEFSEGFCCGAVFDSRRTEQFTAKRDELVATLGQKKKSFHGAAV